MKSAHGRTKMRIHGKTIARWALAPLLSLAMLGPAHAGPPHGAGCGPSRDDLIGKDPRPPTPKGTDGAAAEAAHGAGLLGRGGDVWKKPVVSTTTPKLTDSSTNAAALATLTARAGKAGAFSGAGVPAEELGPLLARLRGEPPGKVVTLPKKPVVAGPPTAPRAFLPYEVALERDNGVETLVEFFPDSGAGETHWVGV